MSIGVIIMDNNGLKLKLNTVVVRKNDVPFVDMSGETGLMSVEKGKYYCIDIIGTQIWNIIEQPISIQELISKLLDEYDVNQEECTSDVMDFISLLYENGLILFK